MHQGSCQCGESCYEFTGEPLTCYACHCTDCQTSTGSAFTLSMIVNEADIKITKGNLNKNNISINGSEVQRHHCPNCGIAFWYSAKEHPGILALKPGTFDDTYWFKPIAHLWVRSAQPWVTFEENSIQYEKQPEMSELFELWSKLRNA